MYLLTIDMWKIKITDLIHEYVNVITNWYDGQAFFVFVNPGAYMTQTLITWYLHRIKWLGSLKVLLDQLVMK